MSTAKYKYNSTIYFFKFFEKNQNFYSFLTNIEKQQKSLTTTSNQRLYDVDKKRLNVDERRWRRNRQKRRQASVAGVDNLAIDRTREPGLARGLRRGFFKLTFNYGMSL